MSDDDLLTRLAAHRTIGGAPREELEWLMAHGTLEHFEPGFIVAKKGEPVNSLYILLTGRISHYTQQGGWRAVMTWRGGDVTGQLPYSRMATAPGNSLVEEPTEGFTIPRERVGEMPVAAPYITAALVHVMIDRARAFKSSDLQMEKMASLGKLAAGLAHELNNPASAAMRSAQLVTEALVESDAAARALGAAGLADDEYSLIDRARTTCMASAATAVLTPLERADREEALADWLVDHDVDDSYAATLAETEVTLTALDELARGLEGAKLNATLHWLAAGCTVRGLARDIERAASRVHALVSAVKGFTYMDHATAPEPVDVPKGLTDTLAVLASKARAKSVSITIDAPANLPRASAVGGELNQVWINLVDNAIDAVNDGGRIGVTVRAEDDHVVVRVTDNGPGISDDMKTRIFDPFFTTKGVGKGTGLGLDIVRRLVEQNNGQIDLESEPGRTEFRVAVPAVSSQ